MAEDVKEVDRNYALDSAWLCFGGPSETCPGCDAVGYVYYGLSDGMEVMLTHFAGFSGGLG